MTIFISEKAKKNLPKRHPFDAYATPQGLCNAVISSIWRDKMNPKVMDAGAGIYGPWGKAMKERFPESELWGVELRETENPGWYDHWYPEMDFLKMKFKKRTECDFDFVIGNPPFKYAEEFIRKGLSILKTRGFLYYLIRISFLESIGRAEGLFKELPMWGLKILPRRPSFYTYQGKKTTNATAFAVFVWRKNDKSIFGPQIKWLDWNYDSTIYN